jgi:hypothetical protein
MDPRAPTHKISPFSHVNIISSTLMREKMFWLHGYEKKVYYGEPSVAVVVMDLEDQFGLLFAQYNPLSIYSASTNSMAPVDSRNVLFPAMPPIRLIGRHEIPFDPDLTRLTYGIFGQDTSQQGLFRN